uniref:Uncharacterized protein n=1 Tax=Megaselia scalaris TaxID=36166 RepID=T1GX21_MEGSC
MNSTMVSYWLPLSLTCLLEPFQKITGHQESARSIDFLVLERISVNLFHSKLTYKNTTRKFSSDMVESGSVQFWKLPTPFNTKSFSN